MIQSFLCIPHILVGYAGGRAPKVGALGDTGAVAEERKLFRQESSKFAGNAYFRCRSNRLIPALYIKYISKTQDYVTQKSL